MKYLIIIISLNLYLSISYCKEVFKKRDITTNFTYLTTNYTIDFFRNNTKTQKCYSNEECPHYSNGCYISPEMFQSKGIISKSNYNRNTLNVTKEYLEKNNIYGICSYYQYCTENKNKTISNDNCIVKEYNGKDEIPSYLSDDRDLYSYNLKKNFHKNNVTKVDHCNEDSIENKYCDELIDISCKENINCITNNCNSNKKCVTSKDFTIYICTNNFGLTYDITANTNEIKVSAECKKMDNEYCNDSSECVENFSVNGYCLNKINYDDVHSNDKWSRVYNIVGIILCIVALILSILFFICAIKMCCYMKKRYRES